ncbi:protein of unknown function [Cyanobium sp. NIES-981]|nr:protein of unknown function [Cyanobium sp. NIES-981]
MRWRSRCASGTCAGGFHPIAPPWRAPARAEPGRTLKEEEGGPEAVPPLNFNVRLPAASGALQAFLFPYRQAMEQLRHKGLLPSPGRRTMLCTSGFGGSSPWKTPPLSS